MSKIIKIERLDDTIMDISGIGDCFYMTWASDDRQYTNMNDGFGWEDLPEFNDKFYNTKLFAINGDAPNHTFHYLPGYPELENDFTSEGRQNHLHNRYYGFGIVAVGDRIYNFLGTLMQATGVADYNAFIGVKLIYSDDNGETWKNQDGSSPVVWEKWEDRNQDNMLFFNEPDAAFSILTVLQMGKAYQANKDGYVYIYSNNGLTEGTMNQLVMFRVKKDKVLDRSAYEYFTSIDADGEAVWSKDINERGIVYTFPEGWVNETYGHPFGWQPDIVYNEALDLYMMINWGIGVGEPEDKWFAKPSYLGIWTAPTPWGPWTQVHEETEWLPGGHKDTRAYIPRIAPKWIAEDGKSFWLVWTDFRSGIPGTGFFDIKTANDLKSSLPYYAFNCQKVLIYTE
ncbi:MAG: DUF4185 domain-containing protein [Aggregatilineales bacterium]